MLIEASEKLRYIKIGDVTQYGLITSYIEGTLDMLPTRAEYQVKEGDILLAINISSRGTVVFIPKQFNGAICTSGFFVIRPSLTKEGYLLWYSLRSEYCRKQIYLAQTASQPELKIDTWYKYFQVPMPIGIEREKAYEKAKKLTNI
ncbi:MAG: hypothetical protein STSR0004_18600 [Peptococcaceae bacterium]